MWPTYFLAYLQRRWLYLKAGIYILYTNLSKVSAATYKVLAANQYVRQALKIKQCNH